MTNLQMITAKKSIVLISISLLVACGGNPISRPTHRPPAASPAETQAPAKKIVIENTAPVPSNSIPETKPAAGGYYLDDGPGENAPANIDSIPGATLKTEQPSKRANRPYIALGQKYTPMTTYAPYKKQGIASWYGKRFHGKKTSVGEIYDMYAMSAAHTTLPIPSYAKVTNPANGRSVIVRINDRGPFKSNRLIDLSYAAAYQLRLIKQGSGLVELETIDTSATAMQNVPSNNTLATQAPPTNTTEITAIMTTTTVTPVAVTQAVDSSTLEKFPTPVASSTPNKLATAQANSISQPYYVQVGAFKNEVNGSLLQKKIQALDLVENVGVANVYNDGLYRVKLGPYSDKKEADVSATKIRQQLNISALVTNQ